MRRGETTRKPIETILEEFYQFLVTTQESQGEQPPPGGTEGAPMDAAESVSAATVSEAIRKPNAQEKSLSQVLDELMAFLSGEKQDGTQPPTASQPSMGMSSGMGALPWMQRSLAPMMGAGMGGGMGGGMMGGGMMGGGAAMAKVFGQAIKDPQFRSWITDMVRLSRGMAPAAAGAAGAAAGGAANAMAGMGGVGGAGAGLNLGF